PGSAVAMRTHLATYSFYNERPPHAISTLSLHDALPISHCIYVGDDERDVIAGKAAGMHTVAAAYGYCELSEVAGWKADAIVKSPAEIWPVIEKLWPRIPERA